MSDETRTIEFEWGDRTFKEVIEGNIELSEMTPDEITDALNRAVGKYAYYSSLRADAKAMQGKIDTEYATWYASKYSEISNQPDFKKATVKTLETQVILDYEKEWKQWQKRKRVIQNVIDKLYVLVSSFELMTKTLQSVLAMLRAELSNAQHSGPIRGSGDLLTD